MEKPNQFQNLEPGIICELPDTIRIPRTRYDELIRAEMEREILFHAYQLMDKYDVENVLDAIFNPKFKYRKQDASSVGATSEKSAADAK